MGALSISLKQAVNGKQLLIIASLLLLSAAIAATIARSSTTIIIPFTSMYGSLQSQNLDFSIVLLNLMFLVLYVLRLSSFIQIQFFVLNVYD